MEVVLVTYSLSALCDIYWKKEMRLRMPKFIAYVAYTLLNGSGRGKGGGGVGLGTDLEVIRFLCSTHV